MKTNSLSELISKYSVGGNVDSVKISVKGNSASVGLITADKTLYGEVTVPGFDIEDSDLPVYQTALLTKILKVFGSEIKISPYKVEGVAKYIDISDSVMDARFVLADASIIPQTPKLKTMPEFQVSIPITAELVSKIASAGNALDVNHITFNSDGTNVVTVTIGYSNNNTTRVKFNVSNANVTGALDYVSFNLSYIREILNANSNMKNGIMKISNSGMMHISMDDVDKKSDYYMVKVNHH